MGQKGGHGRDDAAQSRAGYRLQNQQLPGGGDKPLWRIGNDPNQGADQQYFAMTDSITHAAEHHRGNGAGQATDADNQAGIKIDGRAIRQQRKNKKRGNRHN